MNSTQQYIVQQLRKELGEAEETEHLIDWLLDAWETLEILRDRFGETRALQLLTAYAPLLGANMQKAVMV
ncbi:MAG TPA: hypothetical protein VFV38_50560 [Ktedonobacteraceae bacterium]|nr:hypothetical protein [Ktedonobacteraceae bacterium]